MTTLLIKNAHIITMDDHQREIPDGGLFIRRALIREVGPMSEMPATADEVLDLKGHLVLPGLVNTHHHSLYKKTRKGSSLDQVKLLFDGGKDTPQCVCIRTI